MRYFSAIVILALLAVAALFVGAVDIPASVVADALLGRPCDPAVSYIVLSSRLPQAITAIMAGAALAVSGLLMQTMFRNPLAGPSILGISSGASLGVALVMLLMGSTVALGSLALSGRVAVVAGAFVGSLAVMGVLMLLASILRSHLMLIITGVLIGYLTNSIITLLSYSATARGVQSYVMWGMGTFGGVSLDSMPVFCAVSGVLLLLSFLLVKPLDALLLGDDYALNLGMPLRTVRTLVLLAAGGLTAIATAYCGPIAFIGLATPHIARLIWPTDCHRTLLPATALMGAVIALACSVVSVLPSAGVAPINAITPLVGVPVVLYVVLKRRY